MATRSVINHIQALLEFKGLTDGTPSQRLELTITLGIPQQRRRQLNNQQVDQLMRRILPRIHTHTRFRVVTFCNNQNDELSLRNRYQINHEGRI
jgi:hypothetical protein